jgi:SAM-dependent methyltransferase
MLRLNDYEKNLAYDKEVLQNLLSFGGQSDFLQDKKILEIGPGPDLLLGLLFLEAGGASYQAIDYFSVLSAPIYFYENLKKSLSAPRALTAVDQIIASLSEKLAINYPLISYQILKIENIAEEKSLNNDFAKYDFIFSKDVLEHVENLDNAFQAMFKILENNGVMIHKIDFQTHTSFIQETDPLNFLRYNDYIYKKLVKFKGGPNRWRLPELISIAERTGFKIEKIYIDKEINESDLTKMKKYFSEYYRNIGDNYLVPLSAWIMFKKVKS